MEYTINYDFTKDERDEKYNVGRVNGNWDKIDTILKEIKDYATSEGLKKINNSQISIDETMASNSDSLIPSQKATKTYIDTQVANIVDSSPALLNTLDELAAALGDDANFATTMTNALAGKVDKSIFTGENDFIVGSGVGAYVKKTLAEVRAILNIDDGATKEPIGAISFIPHTSLPSGWLKANGAAISRTTYSVLFSLIGTTFGAGDSSTTFNLPDLRGEFIRGFDDGRIVDIGRTLGSAQTESIKLDRVLGNMGLAISGQYVGNGVYVQGSGAMVTSLGTETRPRNIALMAIIKY